MNILDNKNQCNLSIKKILIIIFVSLIIFTISFLKDKILYNKVFK